MGLLTPPSVLHYSYSTPVLLRITNHRLHVEVLLSLHKTGADPGGASRGAGPPSFQRTFGVFLIQSAQYKWLDPLFFIPAPLPLLGSAPAKLILTAGVRRGCKVDYKGQKCPCIRCTPSRSTTELFFVFCSK